MPVDAFELKASAISVTATKEVPFSPALEIPMITAAKNAKTHVVSDKL